MDHSEREQIRLILDTLVSENLRINESKQRAMHAKYAAQRVLRNGNTVKQALAITEEQVSSFIDAAVSGVRAVAVGPDAFAMISDSLERLFEGYIPMRDEAVRLATGGAPSRSPSVAKRADDLLTEIRERAVRRLAIARFDFVKEKAHIGNGVAVIPSEPIKPRNPGGKPLAAHWDAMWAAIAVKLWTGELNPKSQAEVKKAMFDWLNSEGIDAGDTAITGRARQLWQAMQEADS